MAYFDDAYRWVNAHQAGNADRLVCLCVDDGKKDGVIELVNGLYPAAIVFNCVVRAIRQISPVAVAALGNMGMVKLLIKVYMISLKRAERSIKHS